MTKKELWLQIKNYHFENLVHPSIWDNISSKFCGKNPFTKAFVNKINDKHKFKDYKLVLRAIGEYKKFVYLGVVSDCIVTPSKIIDTIWHEHLLFTSGYRNFCKDIISYNFDHNPQLLQIEVQTKVYNAQYEYTLKLYQTEFGIKPPAQFWGETKYKNDELSQTAIEPKKKSQQKNADANNSDYENDMPLVNFFYYEIAETPEDFGEFGGGDGSGGGASGEWGNDDDSSTENSDSTDGGSDAGGCSSGCGGGD